VSARDVYPERLISFVSIDPRRLKACERAVAWIEKRDCVGFGELKNELEFDDPRNEAIYEMCDHYRLPIVFHMDPTLCRDEEGLPRLDAMAGKYPHAVFVGHGPGFWSAISGDDNRGGGYPDGPVAPGGALDKLLGEHANVYAEISAGSGHNALTRDPEFTEGFLERNHSRLIFGTDYLQAGQELPQIEWLALIDLPIEWRQEIAFDNALRILRIERD
jgi:predicted TIM-barrel fold metal-dependent hydrolase